MIIMEEETFRKVSVTVPEEMTAELGKRARALNVSIGVYCQKVLEEWMNSGEMLPFTE